MFTFIIIIIIIIIITTTIIIVIRIIEHIYIAQNREKAANVL